MAQMKTGQSQQASLENTLITTEVHKHLCDGLIMKVTRFSCITQRF